MSNFDFLKQEWYSLFKKMKKAESRIRIEPATAAHGCRLVLEECIFRMYDIEFLEFPYNTSLANLTEQEEFKALLTPQMWSSLKIIRKTGNSASHYGNKVTSKDAMISIRYLFIFLKWFAQQYSKDLPSLPGLFSESIVPKVGAQAKKRRDQEAERARELAEMQAQIEAFQKAAAEAASADHRNTRRIQRSTNPSASHRRRSERSRLDGSEKGQGSGVSGQRHADYFRQSEGQRFCGLCALG